MLKSSLILGSGRSGTSLLAGLLRNAGYFMGESLIQSNESNPKGYFEDQEVNDINESLLARVMPRRPPILGRWILKDRLGWGQRWLARLPVDVEISPVPREIERIRALTRRQPFCFKDPRLSYTLPVWRPHLGDAVFLCVFRHPAATARSILKECQVKDYLKRLPFTPEDALDVWTHVYRQILDVHRKEGDWLFVHYDQIVNGDALDAVASFTGAEIDRSFPDPTLSRSRFAPKRSGEALSTSSESQDLYAELCSLAGVDPAVERAGT